MVSLNDAERVLVLEQKVVALEHFALEVYKTLLEQLGVELETVKVPEESEGEAVQERPVKKKGILRKPETPERRPLRREPTRTVPRKRLPEEAREDTERYPEPDEGMSEEQDEEQDLEDEDEFEEETRSYRSEKKVSSYPDEETEEEGEDDEPEQEEEVPERNVRVPKTPRPLKKGLFRKRQAEERTFVQRTKPTQKEEERDELEELFEEDA